MYPMHHQSNAPGVGMNQPPLVQSVPAVVRTSQGRQMGAGLAPTVEPIASASQRFVTQQAPYQAHAPLGQHGAQGVVPPVIPQPSTVSGLASGVVPGQMDGGISVPGAFQQPGGGGMSTVGWNTGYSYAHPSGIVMQPAPQPQIIIIERDSRSSRRRHRHDRGPSRRGRSLSPRYRGESEGRW